LSIEKFDINSTVRIMLNQNLEMLYSNVSRDMANSYLEKLAVLENLKDKSMQYCNDGYYVIIDKLVLSGQPYYLIIIIIKNDCSSCTKALKDDVTGLFNRHFLNQIMKDKIPCLKTSYSSLIMADIDNLKEINDMLGHLEGDKAIQIVGDAIRKCIRKEDIAVRYGGDEFIILLPNIKKETAKKVILRIKKEIENITKEQNINIGISAGIACNNSLLNIEEMIKIADKDLYKEKKIKKSKEKSNNEKLNRLFREIEQLKSELNTKVIQDSGGINAEETLKISKKLDELIVKYIKDKK